MRHWINLLRDRRGSTAIEYAAIASLVSVAAVAAFHGLGQRVDAKFIMVNHAVSETM